MLKNGLKKLSAVLAVSAVAMGISPVCMPSNAMKGTQFRKNHHDTDRQTVQQRRIDAFNREGQALNREYSTLALRASILDVPRYDTPADYCRVLSDELRINNLSGLSAEQLENITRSILMANVVKSGIQSAPNLHIGNFDQVTQDLIQDADSLFHRLTAHNQERDRLIRAGFVFA